MAEETVDVQVDNVEPSQEQMQNDYFSTHALIDDPTDAIKEKNTEEPEKPVAPKDLKADKAEKKETDKPAEVPAGFADQFYIRDDKGNSTFNPEAALGFLMPKETTFGYRRPEQPQQEPAAPAAPAQPEVPQWKKERDEERAYETSLRETLYAPLKNLRARFPEGMPPEIYAYVQQEEDALRERIDEHMRGWKWEREESREKERAERESKTAMRATYQAKRQANESVLAAKLGGSDKMQSFLFGNTGKDGKALPGLVTDRILHIFDLQNPDKRNLHGQKYSEAVESWWDEFGSNPDNLEMLYELGIARLQRQLWPNLVKHIGAQQAQQAQGLKKTMTRRPGVESAVPVDKPDSPQGFKDLDQFLNVSTV